MAEMSPVELLRTAAAKVREAAAGASIGPWESADDGLVWADRLGDPVSGSTELEDAAWIALVHPGLAEPLAAWLEQEAAAVEETLADLTCGAESLESAMRADAVERYHGPALRLARALLGVPDGR